MHANARLNYHGRVLLVTRVRVDERPIAHVARELGISRQCGSRWVHRYDREGWAGLLERSSRPHHQPHRTPDEVEEKVLAARLDDPAGPEILAGRTGVAARTITRILERHGVPRLADCDPMTGQVIASSRRSDRRYEHAVPGDLVHVDVKKLGRIIRAGHRITGVAGKRQAGYHRKKFSAGWEFCHVAIDDATRLAYVEVLADEKAATAVGFLRRAKAFFESYGMTVQAVMTDNGGAYRSTIHALACKALGLKHLRTRAYRPQTNGKAERFIRTMLGGWAYGALYRNSQERAAALDGWLFIYNHRRRHAAIGRQTPITRLNNLLGTYS